MKRILTLVIAVSAASASYAGQQYRIKVTNLGPQPLSPVFFSASDANFNIFTLGSGASAGIKAIAEGGNTAPMFAIASAAGASVGAFGAVGSSPIGPGGTAMTTFSADAAHDYFSFASMLGKTNDGFIGESKSSMGLRLTAGGNPTGFTLTILGARAWDAGTEFNSQNAADLGFLGGSGNPAETAGSQFVRVHDTIIPNFGDSWSQLPDWDANTAIARIEVSPVPEPATLSALGLSAVALLRRRRSSR